jgi:hypothetical protein
MVRLGVISRSGTGTASCWGSLNYHLNVHYSTNTTKFLVSNAKCKPTKLR